MNDKTLEMLQAMAATLGTTAQHLWAVLVRQALVDGITNLFLIAGWLITLIAFCKLHLYFSKIRTGDKEDRYSRDASLYETYEAAAIAPMVLVGLVLTIVSICMIFDVIPSTITDFVNPEFAALKYVLGHLK